MKKIITSLVILLSLASQAFGASTGGVGGEPLVPLDTDNPGWFIYQLDRGETYEDTLLLKNTSNTQWKIRLYASDYVKPSGGGFDVKQYGERMNQVGKWVTLSESEVILDPNTTKEIPFTITIPFDSEPGETAGAIMMQQFDPETDETPTQERPGGITLSFRTGVRIYNTTSDPIQEELIHKGSSIVQKTDERTGDKYIELIQRVQNSGNISTKVYYEYIVENALSGKKYYENTDSERYFLVSPDTEFPSIQHIGKGIDDALPIGGLLDIKVKVSHGMKDGTKEVIFESQEQIFIFPLFRVLTILGAIILALFIFFLYRHISWKKYIVQKKDTIESVAIDFDTRVSKLRKRNHLSRGYILQENEIILVPR